MKGFIVMSLLCLIASGTRAQGCSDAGVCSIGGMKEQSSGKKKYSIALNTQYGVGEQNVGILIPQLEFTAALDSHYGIQVKLPYVFTSGNLGKTSGPGDIIVALSRKAVTQPDFELGINAGFRLAVNRSDIRQANSLANQTPFLPMPYQTSLGTYDLLLGADLKYRSKWLLAAGLQWPLLHINSNSFDTAILLQGESEKKNYFSSKNLRRMPDLVLKIDRQIMIGKTISLNAGLLPIFHLGNDTYETVSGRKTIDNSSGLTLNALAGLRVALGKGLSITARYASPLIVRKVRPDGLTRHYVGALELRYDF